MKRLIEKKWLVDLSITKKVILPNPETNVKKNCKAYLFMYLFARKCLENKRELFSVASNVGNVY